MIHLSPCFVTQMSPLSPGGRRWSTSAAHGCHCLALHSSYRGAETPEGGVLGVRLDTVFVVCLELILCRMFYESIIVYFNSPRSFHSYGLFNGSGTPRLPLYCCFIFRHRTYPGRTLGPCLFSFRSFCVLFVCLFFMFIWYLKLIIVTWL